MSSADDRLMTPKMVARYMGVTTRQLRRRMKAGGFPEPIRASRKVLHWRRSQIDAYLASRRGGAGGGT